jgi:stage IV sporulation protein FB
MRMANIPVTISPAFWLLAGLIGYMNSHTIGGIFLWMLVILISVMAHEFGHAFTGKYFGQKVKIELVAFGGLTTREGPKLKWWKEFLIVLNGPLMGFLLFLVALGAALSLKESESVVLHFFYIMAIVNFFWSIVNLVPVLPLDGGQLLRIGLEAAFGSRGLKAAVLLSLGLGVGLGLLFFAKQAVFLGVVFMILAFESYRIWKQVQNMSECDQDNRLIQLFEAGKEELKHGRLDLAAERFRLVCQSAGEGVLYISATQELALICNLNGKQKEAYDLLLPIQKSLESDNLGLFHRLAYNVGDWETAAKVGTHVFQVLPTYETALVNALSCSLLNHAQASVGWLRCAIREGIPNVKTILQKEEFDPIRETVLFKELLKSV